MKKISNNANDWDKTINNKGKGFIILTVKNDSNWTIYSINNLKNSKGYTNNWGINEEKYGKIMSIHWYNPYNY